MGKEKWFCIGLGFLFVALFVNSWSSLRLFSHFKIEINKEKFIFPFPPAITLGTNSADTVGWQGFSPVELGLPGFRACYFRQISIWTEQKNLKMIKGLYLHISQLKCWHYWRPISQIWSERHASYSCLFLVLLYHRKDFSIPSRRINIFPWARMVWKWLIFHNSSW